MSLNSILPEGKKIQVRMTGNICSGGISENITDQVHPSVISTCQEIAACFDLDLAGIDILTTDISRPLEETGGKISEVNQNPDIVMHTDPYLGEPIDTARMFTEYLFPTSKDAWIDID
ncbi:MAG: cyanophycin synthetase, partial [Thermodesulfobacteriota bacterium]